MNPLPSEMTAGVKTYRAPSMPEALAKVQADLGSEALVLAAHKVLAGPAWQIWRNPEIEVLALPGGAQREERKETPPALPTPRHLAKHPERSEGASPAAFAWPGPLKRVHAQLLAQGIDRELAGQVAANAAEMLGPRALGDDQHVRDFVAGELTTRLLTGEYLPRKGEQRLVVLVGPTGVGKTSAAAKLAAYAHYILGRSAAIISLDTFRIGALAQINTFAEILRLPLTVAYTPADLNEALDEHKATDVIIIDTPSRNPRRAVEIVELAALLAPLPSSRRTFLVASATAKLNDMADAEAAFRGLELNGLLCTKLDETGTHGSLYSLSYRTGLPISYFCSGPRVPQDIEPASAERLVELLLR